MAGRVIKKEEQKAAQKTSTDRPPLVKVGALWLKTSRRGDKFMSGIIEVGNGVKNLMVFKNGYKEESSKHPDYVIYESPEHDRGTKATDDDIPF